LSIFSFDWDPEKNIINVGKHNVTFLEAETVFDDDNMIYRVDLKHSKNEERFFALGMSEKPRLLLVCHCIREGLKIRIISARKPTKAEAKYYEEG